MATTQPTTPDPFAAMGGGQFINGGWVPNNHPLAQQTQGAQAVQTAQAPTAPSTTGAPAPAPPASPSSIQGAYQQALQNFLVGPSPAGAAANVASSPAVTAYQGMLQKQGAKDRAFLAERGAAGGFSNSGGMETGLMGMRQDAGQKLAEFTGNQAQVAENNRRDELFKSLALAQQMGDTNSAQALQRELFGLNLGLQQDQLGYNYANLQNQMNQAALLALLGG